jgi:hypothetical protein
MQRTVSVNIAALMALCGLLITAFTAENIFSGPLGIAVTCFAVTMLFFVNLTSSIIFLLICIIFQNLLYTFLSPFISTKADLTLLQGVHFAIIAIIGVLSLGVVARKGILDRKILLYILATLAILCVYGAIGTWRSSFSSAASYFRYYANGIFLFCIGALFGEKHPFEYLVRILYRLLLVSLFVCLLELVLDNAWYEFSSSYAFLKVKYVDWEFGTDVSQWLHFRFMNLPGIHDIYSRRLLGTVMHHVSQSYLLSLLALIAVYLRRYVLAALVLLLAVVTGVKGAIITTFFAFALLGCRRALGPRHFPLSFALLAGYVVAAVIYGTYVKDWHVIGLTTSLKMFPQHPLGNGLGLGGNLSQQYMIIKKFGMPGWSAWQDLGRADFALESGLGVLLYQVGIFTGVFVGFYRRVALEMHRLLAVAGGALREYVFILALVVILVNSLFQEEAFSPYASGLLFLLAGCQYQALARRSREKSAAKQDG